MRYNAGINRRALSTRRGSSPFRAKKSPGLRGVERDMRGWLLRKRNQINARLKLSIALCEAIEAVPLNRRSGTLWQIGFSELAIAAGLIYVGRAIDFITQRPPGP